MQLKKYANGVINFPWRLFSIASTLVSVDPTFDLHLHLHSHCHAYFENIIYRLELNMENRIAQSYR